MPRVNRSPPKASISSQIQTQSEPNISQAVSKNENSPATSRQKRPRTDCSPSQSLDDFKQEMRDLLAGMRADQRSYLNKMTDQSSKLMSEIADLKRQNTEIQKTNMEIEKSMSFISQQYEAMKN